MSNETQVKKHWQERDFSFGIWEDPPGQVWLDYSHDVDELFMLIKGNVELIIEGHSIYPAVGQEILIPANKMHTVKNIGATASTWFYGYKKGK